MWEEGILENIMDSTIEEDPINHEGETSTKKQTLLLDIDDSGDENDASGFTVFKRVTTQPFKKPTNVYEHVWYFLCYSVNSYI